MHVNDQEATSPTAAFETKVSVTTNPTFTPSKTKREK